MAEIQTQVAGVREWYNLIAENFSLRYAGLGGVFWKCFEEEVALELLSRPGPRILDVGCGPGRLAASLSALAQEVVGIDISEAMIKIAWTAPHPSNVCYAVMDATATAFEAGKFDAVISLGMFEYLTDPAPFLHEIFRLLRPGGRLVFTVHSQSGEKFLWWWTLPGRLVRKVRQAVSPASSVSGGGTYFGQPVTLRKQLYSKASHSPLAVLQFLGREGFHRMDYRGFLFAPSTGLFGVASHVPVHAISRAGIAVACQLDHWLGGSLLTRNLSTLAMFVAQKPE